MSPSLTPASTGKTLRRCSRSSPPLSQRGESFATARKVSFFLSRLLAFETRHWDGTALPARKCDIYDHIPYVPACMNQKSSPFYSIVPGWFDSALAQLHASGATARITTVRLKKLIWDANTVAHVETSQNPQSS